MMVATEDHYVGSAMNGVGGATSGDEPNRPRPPYASASANAHIEGLRFGQDLITIPAEQIQ
jgi:hypothetical protein